MERAALVINAKKAMIANLQVPHVRVIRPIGCPNPLGLFTSAPFILIVCHIVAVISEVRWLGISAGSSHPWVVVVSTEDIVSDERKTRSPSR